MWEPPLLIAHALKRWCLRCRVSPSAPSWQAPPCCVLCWALNALQCYQCSVSLPSPSVLSRPGQDRTCHLLVGFRQDLICVWRLFCKALWSSATPIKTLGIIWETWVVVHVVWIKFSPSEHKRGPEDTFCRAELEYDGKPKSHDLVLCFSGRSGSKHKVGCLLGAHGGHWWTHFCQSTG